MTSQQLMTTNGATAHGEPPDLAAVLEQVIISGDLERLSAAERVIYYRGLCESLGLNPLTRPFDYLKLSGKLTLYPNKNAAEQIRRQAGVSIVAIDERIEGDLYIVKTRARLAGREDMDIGAVSVKGLAGEALGNALKKAVTQSKRRVTFSLCGLGMLDETEIETIPDATRVTVDTAGVIQPARPALSPPMREADALPPHPDKLRAAFYAAAADKRLTFKNDPSATREAINQYLGLPLEEGVLSRMAARFGWEVLKQRLEAGEPAIDLWDAWQAERDAAPPDPDDSQPPLLDLAPEREPAHAARGSH